MGNIIEQISDRVNTQAYMNIGLSEWRNMLAKECQVYVFGEIYLAKRFDQINYKFCSREEAKEVIVDNLYAILRFKYFPKQDEEVDKKIEAIVKSFTINLKSTILRVSLDKSADCNIVQYIPDYCIAFRNGVYDFKNDTWFLRYEVVDMKVLSNKMYLYDTKYIIMWYFDFNFEPLSVKVMDMELKDFIEWLKDSTKRHRNYCFELCYNISHSIYDDFVYERFAHLCEVMGYTLLQSFSQFFVMLIGSGQNGKNSLFDGCMTYRLVPKPAANDLDSLETDNFITGSLENKAQNIFLETSAKTYTENKMLKALTGSMYQTISQKNIPKYSSIINCKYVFAANDQDNTKFLDTTIGFRRRINMLEIYYHWDSQKRFMYRGDYYDTSFSDSLKELKDDIINTVTYIYLAMFGIKMGTNNFEDNFKFHYNDWNESYMDINRDLKDRVSLLTPKSFADYMSKNNATYENGKTMFFGDDKKRLYTHKIMSYYDVSNYDSFIAMLKDDGRAYPCFEDIEFYLSVKTLQDMLGYKGTKQTFSNELKRACGVDKFYVMCQNQSYVKATFINGFLMLMN